MAFVLQSLSLPWGTLFFRNFKALLLEETFLIFRELGVLTRRVLGLIYTPSPVSMPGATREARRPMGSRFPGLTLTFNGLRQWSRERVITVIQSEHMYLWNKLQFSL
jgi:hypothetical protein